MQLWPGASNPPLWMGDQPTVKQEVYSRDDVTHIGMSNLWFSNERWLDGGRASITTEEVRVQREDEEILHYTGYIFS